MPNLGVYMTRPIDPWGGDNLLSCPWAEGRHLRCEALADQFGDVVAVVSMKAYVTPRQYAARKVLW